MNSYYLQVDLNITQNQNIVKLKSKLGHEGLGLYLELILKLSQQENYKLFADYAVLAYDLRTEEEKIKTIINDFNLFILDGDCFFSEYVNLKMQSLEKRKEAGRIAGLSSASKRKTTIVQPSFNDSSTEKRREEKKKEDKIRKDKIKENKEIIEEFFENSDFKGLISNKIIAYENQVWFSEQADITIKSIKENMIEYYTENPKGKKQEIKNITSRFYKFLESYKRADFYKYKEKTSSLGETTTEEQMKDKFENATVWL